MKCTQIDDNSKSNSNEDGEEIDSNEIALFLIIYFAICIIAPVWFFLSILYIIAGISRNERLEDVMFCNL